MPAAAQSSPVERWSLETSKPDDVITVSILEGDNLQSKEAWYKVLWEGRYSSDTYVVASLCGVPSTAKRSSTQAKTIDPDWTQTEDEETGVTDYQEEGEVLFDATGLPDREALEKDPYLRLVLWDQNEGDEPDLPMGLVAIPLADLARDVAGTHDYHVADCKEADAKLGIKQCTDATGTLTVRVFIGARAKAPLLRTDGHGGHEALVKSVTVASVLKEHAAKGAKSLEVESAAGFLVDSKVQVGSGFSKEVRHVLGVDEEGRLTLRRPMIYKHAAGEGVALLEPKPREGEEEEEAAEEQEATRGAEPSLKLALEECGLLLEEQLEVCESKIIEPELVEHGVEQTSGWDEPEVDEAFEKQAEDLLPELKKLLAAQEKADKKKKAKEKEKGEQERKKEAEKKKKAYEEKREEKKKEGGGGKEKEEKKGEEGGAAEEKPASKDAAEEKPVSKELGEKLDEMSEEEACAHVWGAVQQYMKDNGKERALQVFRQVDEDKNGAIDLGEFVEALQVCGLDDVPENVAKKIMKTVDKSGDNLLQYEEFVAALSHYKPASAFKRGAEPSLARALAECDMDLDEQIEVCETKIISFDLVEHGIGQTNAWDEDEVELAFERQADDLLPELKNRLAEEEKDQDEEEKAAGKERRKRESQEKKEKKEEEKKKGKEEEKERDSTPIERRKEEEKKKKEEHEKKKKAAAEEAKEKKKQEAKEKAEKKKKEKEDAAAAKKKQQEESEETEEEKAAAKEEEKRKEKERAEKAAKSRARENERKKDRDAEERRRKEEEERRRAEDKEYKKMLADRKKEEDKMKKEQRAEEKRARDEENARRKEEAKYNKAVSDKKREEDRRRAKEEREQRKKQQAANSSYRREERRRRTEQRRQRQADNRQRRQQRQADRRADRERRRQHERESMVYDEEWGRKVKAFNDVDYVQDTCCSRRGYRCCMALAFILQLFVLPGLYAFLIFVEHRRFGWDRVLASWSGVHNMTQFEGYIDYLREQQDLMAQLHNATASHKTRAIASNFVGENPLTWSMPLLALALGLFSNMTPFAPGLVFMTFLDRMEVTTSSEATLALASLVSFLNNGVLGCVAWCCRDARLFICRALCLLVPAGWCGFMVGVAENLSLVEVLLKMDEGAEEPTVKPRDVALMHTYLRLTLGCFMLLMAFFVLVGTCVGGMNRFCCPSHSGGTTPGCISFCQWIIVICCAFNSAYFFTANIGCGMGLFMFFALSVFLGVENKRAMPTAIVIGGWTNLLPALLNYSQLPSDPEGGFPYVHLLILFPWMWFGSVFAPWFSKCGGPMSDLGFYFIFLAGSGLAVVVLASLALVRREEDIDLDLEAWKREDLHGAVTEVHGAASQAAGEAHEAASGAAEDAHQAAVKYVLKTAVPSMAPTLALAAAAASAVVEAVATLAPSAAPVVESFAPSAAPVVVSDADAE